MSNLIKNNFIVEDEWTLVALPAPAEEAVRKQAGKVVIFKVTGEPAATPEQIAATQIPASGKVILPLPVWRARKEELAARFAQGEIGVWIDSFEILEELNCQAFMTGTDQSMFSALGARARYLTVANGSVSG